MVADETSWNLTWRAAFRSALLPAVVYILVALVETAVGFVTADARRQHPEAVEWLSNATLVFWLCMSAWAGYRATHTMQGRPATAGLLVQLIAIVLMLPFTVFNAIRSLDKQGSPASTMVGYLVVLSIGTLILASLLGAVAGWIGYRIYMWRHPE